MFTVNDWMIGCYTSHQIKENLKLTKPMPWIELRIPQSLVSVMHLHQMYFPGLATYFSPKLLPEHAFIISWFILFHCIHHKNLLSFKIFINFFGSNWRCMNLFHKDNFNSISLNFAGSSQLLVPFLLFHYVHVCPIFPISFLKFC